MLGVLNVLAVVVATDQITGMNDLFGRVWMENLSPQETDIHWRFVACFVSNKVSSRGLGR